jgi:hypothetical protein
MACGGDLQMSRDPPRHSPAYRATRVLATTFKPAGRIGYAARSGRPVPTVRVSRSAARAIAETVD